MKLKDLYQAIIEIGQRNDPRGIDHVREVLARLQKDYSELSPAKQDFFDRDRLDNPYADTRILNGDPEQEVKSAMVGVDVEVGEILLADRLRAKGLSVDLLISHHPEGKAYAGFYHVMEMQADILHKFGVPINVAEALVAERMGEVERKVMPANFSRAVDAARLLEIAMLCAHTPADNCVTTWLQRLLEDRRPVTVREIIAVLGEIPEYRFAIADNCPPRCVVGEEKRRGGRIFVDMTGGTEGPKEALAKLVEAGVGTLVSMHISPDNVKKAKEHNLNVVVAGHIASDNLGLNLLLDQLSARWPLEVIACSGFKRFSRL